MVGKDDGRAVGEQQVLADLDAGRPQCVDLRQQRLEVHDDAGPDDAGAAADDSRREQVEREVLVAELDGVAGVVAAVIARHDVEAVRQEVDELALALVSPLPAQDGQDLHVRSPRLHGRKSSAG